MSRSIFGWSYPPGCSGPPDDTEVIQPRCSCGAFLGGKPIGQEPWESSSQCDGSADSCEMGMGEHEPHKIIWDGGIHQLYKCKKCGKVNKI